MGTITYFGKDVLMRPSWQRRLNIFMQYGFQCECRACCGQTVPLFLETTVLDEEGIRSYVDEILLKSGVTDLQPVSVQDSQVTHIKRMVPLAVLSSLLLMLPATAIFLLIPDLWA